MESANLRREGTDLRSGVARRYDGSGHPRLRFLRAPEEENIVKRCIVTGAAGLIGSHLIRILGKDWLIYPVSRRDLSTDLKRDHLRHLTIDLSKDWDTGALPERAD